MKDHTLIQKWMVSVSPKGKVLVLFLFLASCSSVFGQMTVSGTVTDKEGETLPGVAVMITGSTTGTITDFDGSYSLNVSDGDSLTFSFLGYEKLTLLANSTSLDVSLTVAAEQLQEVVVVGFGERRKRDLTGSISTVNSKDITKMQAVSPQFALQGNTTGVRVINASGDPNEGPQIFVRGIGTWNGDSQPLYVIDGQIIEPPRAGNQDEIGGAGLSTPPNLFNLINPNDIESISVLKDASAAAIYGNRGANGVVLITTKKGKKGKPTIEFNSFLSSANTPTFDMLNTQQFVDLTNEMFTNNLNPDITIENQLYGREAVNDTIRLQNFSPQFDPNSPFFINDGTTYNWQDELTRQNALTQSYDLKVSGGSDRANYYVSGSYLNTEQILAGNDLERYTAAMNVNTEVTSWLSVGINYKFTRQRSNLINSSDLAGLAETPPWQPLYDSSNELGFAIAQDPDRFGWNRARLYGVGTRTNRAANNAINYSDFTIMRNLGNAYFEVKPIIGLTLRGSLNLDYSQQSRFGVDVRSQVNIFDPNADDPATGAPQAPGSLGGTENRINNIFNYQTDFTATYAKSFARHNFNLTAAVQDQRHTREIQNMSGDNLTVLTSDPRKQGYGNDLGNNSSFYGIGERFWFGGVGRVSYNYDYKYYLDLSYRRDASSGFDDDFRWGNFYSASGAWRISSEPFMEGISFISDLKIRAGYGEAGNDQAAVGQFAFLSGVNTGLSSTRFGSGNGDPLGNLALGALVNDLANPGLSWETVVTTSVGVDALLFENKLSMTLEWYLRETQGILQTVGLPPSTQLSSPLANIGSLENRGVDLQLGYNETIGEFNFNISGNISFLRNRVTELFDDQPLNTGFGRVEEGRSIGHIWGYELGGIFQSESEIAEYYDQFTDETIGNIAFVAPGDMYFLDVQGNPTEEERFYSTSPDGLINNFDQTEIGNTIPGYTYGLNLNASWKGFDVFLGFYGEGDVDKYNFVRARFEGMAGAGVNYAATTLNRWTPQNTDTDMPRAVIGDPAGNNRFSSRYVESAAFFRLNNWQFGYTIPAQLLRGRNIDISRFRVYIGGQNNIYITNWSGIDPVNDTFPLPRTLTAGLNVSF